MIYIIKKFAFFFYDKTWSFLPYAKEVVCGDLGEVASCLGLWMIMLVFVVLFLMCFLLVWAAW